jgi:hypothetical protein
MEHSPSNYFLLSLSLNFLEHLNVTTFLGFSIKLSPVAGLRPLRSFFSLTQNFPKPLIKTSSPVSRARFIISSRNSAISPACFPVKPVFSAIDSTILALVRFVYSELLYIVSLNQQKASFYILSAACTPRRAEPATARSHRIQGAVAEEATWGFDAVRQSADTQRPGTRPGLLLSPLYRTMGARPRQLVTSAVRLNRVGSNNSN